LCVSNTLKELTYRRIKVLKYWLEGSEMGDICGGSIKTKATIQEIKSKR